MLLPGLICYLPMEDLPMECCRAAIENCHIVRLRSKRSCDDCLTSHLGHHDREHKIIATLPEQLMSMEK